jgi:serine/threonine protein kinase
LQHPLKNSFANQLQTEIKIHRSLQHENVVRFDRFFEDKVNAYMKLELCHNNVSDAYNAMLNAPTTANFIMFGDIVVYV